MLGCLGVFFAIDEQTVNLLRLTPRSERAEYVSEELEEDYYAERREQAEQIDKAWDAVHRAFSDGELLFDATGSYPGNAIILGGECLYGNEDGEEDYIITLKTPGMVRDISGLLNNLTEEAFRPLYFAIDQAKYGFPTDEIDFKYTWDNLIGSRDFWLRAAGNGQYVIFTVDQ